MSPSIPISGSLHLVVPNNTLLISAPIRTFCHQPSLAAGPHLVIANGAAFRNFAFAVPEAPELGAGDGNLTKVQRVGPAFRCHQPTIEKQSPHAVRALSIWCFLFSPAFRPAKITDVNPGLVNPQKTVIFCHFCLAPTIQQPQGQQFRGNEVPSCGEIRGRPVTPLV